MASVFHVPFIRNKKLIANGDNAGLDIDLGSATALAILATTPFPHQKMSFGQVTASVAGSTDMMFLTDRGNVGLKGSGSASAGLSVQTDPNDAATAVGMDESVPFGLDLPGSATSHYVLLRWAIDANAAASGKVALGAAGAVAFGADGSVEVVSAVLRRYNDGAQDGGEELIQTAGSWMLPSQIKNVDSLEPGTWIVAEVEGSLALSLGIQYGLNYNWVKAAQVAGLSGDIGLKVQLGASASLGFSIAGKYAVVVSRESLSAADMKIRVRVFKLAKHGFDFAFDAGITAQADFSKLVPPEADEFLRSIFGVHGVQVINTLHDIDQWTGSDNTLGGLLAQTSSKYVGELVTEITGRSAETEFDAAKGDLKKFLDTWNTLDSRTASLVLKFVDDKVDLGQIKQAATFIKNRDVIGLSGFLADKLPAANFSNSPLAQYLEAAAAGSLLTLLNQGPTLDEASKVATATLNVLDGSTIEGMVRNFQARITRTLSLGPLIEKANTLTTMDFASLDKLLQAKLAAFLDKEIKDLAPTDIENLRKAVGLFLAKRRDFYQQALKALNQQYKFEFSATYESAATKTALLDVEFDFAAADFSAALQSVIDGKFDAVSIEGNTVDLLVDGVPGIFVNKAVLTHGLARHTHQEFHMPYFLNVSDHLNKADASFTAGHDAGRVFVSAQAQDITSDVSEFNKNRDRRDSTLGVAVAFPLDVTGAITVHETDGMNLSYQFRQAVTNITPAALKLEARPYAQAYFANLFGDGSTRGSFDTMIDGINVATTARTGSGIGVIGNTLVSLDVSTVPDIASGWFVTPKSPEEEQARLKDISRAIQMAMRRIVPYFYLQDPARYNRQVAISALVLYASLPPIAADPLFFDFNDATARAKLISAKATQTNLATNLQAITDLLMATPGSGGMAGSFVPDGINTERILNDVTSGFGEVCLIQLLGAEADIIQSAAKARTELLQFKATIASNRAQAIQRLAQFSSDLTTAFNKKVVSNYGGAAIRPLGTLMFLQTCLATLDAGTFATSLLPNPFARNGAIPTLSSDKVKALMDITVLKPAPTFPPDGFFDGGDPDRSDALIQSRLVNLGSSV